MNAGQKWLELFVDIVAYESAHTDDGQLLSEACDRWIEKYPVAARSIIIAIGAALIVHLANLISPKYDVISQDFWRRVYQLWKRFNKGDV